jgi:hypothetical protein
VVERRIDGRLGTFIVVRDVEAAVEVEAGHGAAGGGPEEPGGAGGPFIDPSVLSDRSRQSVRPPCSSRGGAALHSRTGLDCTMGLSKR